jgi:alkyldihydroxyacetonephosphate synthase
MTDVLDALRLALGERVVSEGDVLDAHRHDYWALAQLRDLLGIGAPRPRAVVFAESTADVVEALRACRAHRTPVIPFGGASGVCGAIEAHPDAIVLSTRRMDGLVRMSDENLTATFRAGTLGIDAENRVRQDGLTIGHWPQSVALSTVGGWVATRASGQYSTGYGSIEDLVLALEVVLPDGSLIRTRETPRAAAGPDLRQVFMGSEGTLGVVTEVTFSLRPVPEASDGQAFHFAAFAEGTDVIRRIMRAGWRPPVVRLYDANESQRGFAQWSPPGRCLLLVLHEGPATAVRAEDEAVAALCRASGGQATEAAAVDHWLAERNNVPSFRSLNEQGLVVDTIEVACTWDRVVPLYEAVTRSVREAPGVLMSSAHSSHSYRSGTNLYFTFAAHIDQREHMPDAYRECWDRTMRACIELGAGIAHHHGIGRVRRDRLVDEIGETGVELLRTLKRALDPDGLLNPGALLPPDDAGRT